MDGVTREGCDQRGKNTYDEDLVTRGGKNLPTDKHVATVLEGKPAALGDTGGSLSCLLYFEKGTTNAWS